MFVIKHYPNRNSTKKSLPILYNELIYKMGQAFLNMHLSNMQKVGEWIVIQAPNTL